jgi:hypothetical protein
VRSSDLGSSRYAARDREEKHDADRERIEEPIPVIGVPENPWRDRDPGAERADDPSRWREASPPGEARDAGDDHEAAGHV